MLRKLAVLFGTIFCSIISYTQIETIKGLWIIPVSFIVGILLFYIIYFTTCYIITLFISFKKEYKKSSKFWYYILDLTEEFIISLFRVKLKITGYEIVPSDKKYLVVFNHKSLIDPIIISSVLRRDRVIHISKPENFKAFIAGKFMHRCGYLPINRDSDREALKTIVKCVNYLKSDKLSVGAAPEGTRNKGEGLLPFKPGLFKIAMKAQAPIVVVTMNDSRDINKNFPWKKTKMEIKFLEVINPEDYQDKTTIEIANHVRKLMCDDLGYVYDGGIQIEEKNIQND